MRRLVVPRAGTKAPDRLADDQQASSSRVGVWAAFLVAMLLVLVGVRLIGNNFYLDALAQVFLWAGLAGAWNIVGGYAGQLSIGHAAFFGIGAYASSLLLVNLGVSPLVGMAVGGVSSAVAASFLGFFTFRLRGPFFTLATIAFAQVAYILATNLRELTKGSIGLSIPYRPNPVNLVFDNRVDYVYAAFVFMLVVTGISLWVERSRLGYYLLALRDDEDAAETVGADTFRVKLLAAGLSALLTAVGGTLYAQSFLFIDPGTVFGLDVSLQMALLTIIGGTGTALGPMVGAFLLIPLAQVLHAWLGTSQSGLSLFVYGVLLIVAVFLLPRGIVTSLRLRRRQ